MDNPYKSSRLIALEARHARLRTLADRVDARARQLADRYTRTGEADRPDFVARLTALDLPGVLAAVAAWGETAAQPENAVLGNFGIHRMLGGFVVSYDPTDQWTMVTFSKDTGHDGLSLPWAWTPADLTALTALVGARVGVADPFAVGGYGTDAVARLAAGCHPDFLRAQARYHAHPFDSPKEDWAALVKPAGW